MSGWTSVLSIVVAASVGGSGALRTQPPSDSGKIAVEAEPEVDSTGVGVPEPEAGPVEEGEPDEGDSAALFEDALMQEAYDRFVDGNELFLQRRYQAAAESYERSYAAVPTGRVLYNLGLAYEKGGDYVRALEVNLRYVALPDCPAPENLCAANREEVDETVSKLRGKVGTLSVMIDEDVEVQGFEVDDRFIPPEDFPLVLSPGRYELRVRGIRRSEVRTREVEIAAGQITSLVIGGFDAPDPAIEVDTTPPERDGIAAPNRLDEEERRRRLRIAFYGGVGVTALSGVATAVVGGLALQAHREYEARCKGIGTDCTDTMYPQAARDRVEQLRPATNALIGVTAGLGITTVVLGLFAFSERKGAGARASVARVTPSPGGVRVRF